MKVMEQTRQRRARYQNVWKKENAWAERQIIAESASKKRRGLKVGGVSNIWNIELEHVRGTPDFQFFFHFFKKFRKGAWPGASISKV